MKARSHRRRWAVGVITGLALVANMPSGAVADEIAGLDNPVDCWSLTQPRSCTYDEDALSNNVAELTQPVQPPLTDVRTGTLRVQVTGAGSLSSSDGQIDCQGPYNSGSCGASYLVGSPVTVTATPAPGATFLGWTLYTRAGFGSLPCSRMGTSCTLSMAEDFTLEAHFSTPVAPEPTPTPDSEPISGGNGNGKGPKK